MYAVPTIATTERRKRSSDRNGIVSGRSFKRLRLDQTLVSVPTVAAAASSHHRAAFDSHSIGTLSVGTMGGDLESNDEDTGNYDEEDEEIMSVSQSSWVASLPSLNSKRRMPGVSGGLDGVRAVAVAGNNHSNDAGVDDDAATCAEMTTAAVAPRRRVRHCTKKKDMHVDGASSPPLLNGERKRRAVGVAFETVAEPPNRLGRLKNDLTVNEIQVNPQFPAAGVQNQSSDGNRLESSQKSSMMPPPVECIPDPLLVAAQHAAVGGNRDEPNSNETNNLNENGAALFVGDCYSSVTEEETSLAEDEASLSAVSIGGNTTTSLGATTMASSKEGIRRCSSACSNRTDVELKAAPPPAFPTPNVSNAMQQQEKTSSLNYFLGNLHRERQQRQSMHSSPHRRGSSYHSLGSMGVQSHISGNSHQSLPNYPMNGAQCASVNVADSGDMDVDMEGPTGSMSSAHASQANSVNTSQSGEGKDVPKWKRRVKLPSHSSLY